MQAAGPQIILAPLQVGLAIQLHHHFASRFLIVSLCRHKFCCSYQEVQRFEKNAAVDQGTDILLSLSNHTSEFVQYVADNVDHNIRTLDRNDTFHGMGIIATVTPTKHSQLVPRAKVDPDDISTTGHIQIQYQRSVTQAFEIKYNDIVIKKVRDPTANLDILWKTSLLFGLSRPALSGMVQLCLAWCSCVIVVSTPVNQRDLMNKDRTASLWLQYLDTVEILRMFIKAERIGNWRLHLQALSEMLPYLAAAGHNLYTKSVRLYLQSMSSLETDHPDVYRQFEAGFHVVRRSNRLWAGLSTDLVIEQVLMKDNE